MKIKKLVIGVATVCVTGVILVACGGDDSIEITQGTVIQNVTVVSTRDGSLATDMSVVVDAGKIQKITKKYVRASGMAQAVDATGKYVVPGFLDMHTHAMAAVDQQPTYWPLMIANGVTGIREMGGSAALITRARQLNVESAAGRIDAPEVLMIPGDIFGGQAPTAPLAVAFVQKQKANGADFIKLTAGSRDAVLAILGEAKLQSLDVAGHLVPAVSAVDSSNAGWKSVEHLGSGFGFAIDCATDEATLRSSILTDAARPPFPATFTLSPRLYDGTINAPLYQRILNTYSESKCATVAQTFAKNGTWAVPTLTRLRMMNFSDEAVYRTDPNLVYVDKTRRLLWEQLGAQYSISVPTTAATTLRQYFGLYQKLTKLLKGNNVKMLAGSDLGGIWVIPGFGLHQEFRELATAGLTPLEVLQMTTLNGAEFMRREATMGTVDEGKNADLVLLDANPIADVANLAKISAVFLKGKYFSKVALDKLKSDVATAYANQPLQSFHTALDPNHID